MSGYGSYVFVHLLATWALGAPPTPDNYNPGTRPGPKDKPTPVAVGMYVANISDIDDAGQTFTADVLIWLQWQDPRLVDERAGKRTLNLTQVWHPQAVIYNSRKIDKGLPEVVEIGP